MLSPQIVSILVKNLLLSKTLPVLDHGICKQEVVEDCLPFMVYYDIHSDHWICECKMIQHVGLPCTHLMAVVCKFGGEIGAYISHRWLLDTEEENANR